jgi:hypothetical protein
LRFAEELKQERVRLTNRVRQQLWRDYAQMPDRTPNLDRISGNGAG